MLQRWGIRARAHVTRHATSAVGWIHPPARSNRAQLQCVLTRSIAVTTTGVRSLRSPAAAAGAAGVPRGPMSTVSSVGTSSQPNEAPTLPLSDVAPQAQGKVKVALLQLGVGADKATNLSVAEQRIGEAAAQGAQLVVLPEMFNCPYSTQSFGPYSEVLPAVGATAEQVARLTDSPSAQLMSAVAARHGIWLVAGSVPERAKGSASTPRHPKTGSDEHLYNTCLVFNPKGDVVARHRKLHLFDIDVPGKVRFCESDTLTAGPAGPTLFDTPFGRIGVGICYDIRFQEYASLLTSKGASILVYPGAFNTVTGPLHWELLARARAVDNQLVVLTCSPARGKEPPPAYQAWGHSSVVSPWGKVLATTEHEPAIVVAEVDLQEVHEIRSSIPIFTQKRWDVYNRA